MLCFWMHGLRQFVSRAIVCSACSGRAGLKVSALSLGAWVTWGVTVSDDVAYESMRAAYKLGINFFDNAVRIRFSVRDLVFLP